MSFRDTLHAFSDRISIQEIIAIYEGNPTTSC
jgi:hypothetical protein